VLLLLLLLLLLLYHKRDGLLLTEYSELLVIVRHSEWEPARRLV